MSKKLTAFITFLKPIRRVIMSRYQSILKKISTICVISLVMLCFSNTVCLADGGSESERRITMGEAVEGTYVELPGIGITSAGVYLVCEDEQMMNQGNHFNAFVLQDGDMVQLEEQSFSQDLALCGDVFHIELDYAVYNGRAVITYVPANSESEGGFWCLPEAQNPVNSMPLLLTLRDGSYPVLLDLETGKVVDVLADSGIELPKDIQRATFSPDRSALLLRSGDDTPYYCNLAAGIIYDLDELFGAHADVCVLGADRICCLSEDSFRVWTVTLDDHAITEIAPGLDGCVFLPEADMTWDGGFALGLDEAENAFALDLFTGEKIPVEGFVWPGEDTECCLSEDGNKLCIYNYRYENEKLYVDAWVLDYAAGRMTPLNTSGTEEITPHAVCWSGDDHVVLCGAEPNIYYDFAF